MRKFSTSILQETLMSLPDSFVLQSIIYRCEPDDKLRASQIVLSIYKRDGSAGARDVNWAIVRPLQLLQAL